MHRLRLARLSLLAVTLTLQAVASLTVVEPRTEGMNDPVGIDSTSPRLSWKLRSVERAARQGAWQVHAASSRNALLEEAPDLWDSGRVRSDRQFEIEYTGKPLVTGQTVWWRARVWDETGQRSAWGPVSTWMMGFVAPSRWSARWITDPELLALTRTKLGFSTPPTPDENTPHWLVLDLGQTHPIDSITLHALVHSTSERLGFPRWFRLEVANQPDFSDAHVLADHTKDGINLWFTRFAADAKGVQARYVRIAATRLRMIAEEEFPQPVGRLALRQIEVVSQGRNVAQGARVSASASLEEGPWSAAAVVDGKEIPGANPRAAETLLVRREFKTAAPVRRGLLFVTGLGSYTVSINGREIGSEELLKPGWTETDRRCFYATHDVTSMLRAGSNAIGMTLAGGLYHVPAVPGRYTKLVTAPRPLVAFAELHVEYADGRREVIVTDGAWKVSPGPTTFAHLYGGEDYDARRDPSGWTEPGFDDHNWRSAVAVPGPAGELKGESEAGPPLRVTATLPVLTRTELRPGVEVFDLGQNAALMPRLGVRGAAGSTIKIRPAELLNADGSIDPTSTRPAKSDASWNYTLAGRPEGESWAPRFFYHGARYLQVESTAPAGAERPRIEFLAGAVVHADVAEAGAFRSSNELLNRIATMIRWAQRSNFAHVLTDCPHRERLGWLEQYHLNGPSLRYHYDLGRLFAKTFQDMSDAQRPNGLVPSICPEYVRFDEGFRDSPEWGSALILAAWQQYVWNGDTAPLRRHYDAMRRYFEYLESRSTNGILSHGLGDWYDRGPNHPGFAQLTPVPLTATAIFYEDAVVLARIATVLGRADDAARYSARAREIGEAFNREFFLAERAVYATGSQTSLAMPLALGLVPDGRAGAVLEALVENVRAHENSLTSGDVGHRYLLRALGESDRSDVVYDMNRQTEKPGYGFQLARGATSLPEAWDANRRSSQNHFMLGHLIEWLNEFVAGLSPDPAAPGFGRACVRPAPVGNLRWAESTYESVRGPFRVRWDRLEENRLRIHVIVPANASAVVELPASPGQLITEGGVPVSEAASVRALGTRSNRPAFEIGSGDYVFECTLATVPR